MGGQDEAALVSVEPIELEEDGSALAVCLVSGGMDSCVTAAIANQESDAVAFLHVSYGQRTEERERRAFEEIADYFQVNQRLIVSMPHFGLIGGSSLTDEKISVARVDLALAEHPDKLRAFSQRAFPGGRN